MSDCPRCGAALDERQRWCTECGHALGTILPPARSWRRPIVAALAIAAVALVALVVAFAVLTRDDNPVPAATPTAPATP